MSCMMMQPEAVAALADFLEAVLNMSFDYFGFDVPYSLYESAMDCNDSTFYPEYSAAKLYQKLYFLNLAAYNGRYHKEQEAEAQAPDIDIPKYRIHKRVDWVSCQTNSRSFRYVICPWHYQALKLLDFFLYQTEEDATRGDRFFIALREFQRVFLGFIAHNAPEYNSFPWGTL